MAERTSPPQLEFLVQKAYDDEFYYMKGINNIPKVEIGNPIGNHRVYPFYQKGWLSRKPIAVLRPKSTIPCGDEGEVANILAGLRKAVDNKCIIPNLFPLDDTPFFSQRFFKHITPYRFISDFRYLTQEEEEKKAQLEGYVSALIATMTDHLNSVGITVTPDTQSLSLVTSYLYPGVPIALNPLGNLLGSS